MADRSLPPFWPRPNTFLEAMRSPTAAPPSFLWVTLGYPVIVEMAGTAGMDAVIIDMEHSPAGFADVERMLPAADAAATTALVRVGERDFASVGKLLDLGVQGIVFPRVATAEDAEAAAGSVRYPPRGTRGWAGAHARHVRWMGSTPEGGIDPQLLSVAFTEAADAAIALIFMIEDDAGVANIDAILEVGRPDGVVFGWGDFAVSVAMDMAHVAAGRRIVEAACRARGIGIAITVSPPDASTYYPGCFLSAGVDATLFSVALTSRATAAHSAGIACKEGLHDSN